MSLYLAVTQGMFPDEEPRVVAYRARDLRMAAMNYMRANVELYAPVLITVADTLRPDGDDAAAWAIDQLQRPDIYPGEESLQAICAILLRPIRLLRPGQGDMTTNPPNWRGNRRIHTIVIAAVPREVQIGGYTVGVDHFMAVIEERPLLIRVDPAVPPGEDQRVTDPPPSGRLAARATPPLGGLTGVVPLPARATQGVLTQASASTPEPPFRLSGSTDEGSTQQDGQVCIHSKWKVFCNITP